MPKQTKPIKRYGREQWASRLSQNGNFSASLADREIAYALAMIVVHYSHAEEELIELMYVLIGSQDRGVARQIFRAVTSDKARLDILRSLLEKTQRNAERAREFDDALKAFEVVKQKRNHWIHGLWYTHEDSGATYLSDDMTHDIPFIRSKPVKLADLESCVREIFAVMAIIRGIRIQETLALQAARVKETGD
jgi:hypothetical protein